MDMGCHPISILFLYKNSPELNQINFVITGGFALRATTTATTTMCTTCTKMATSITTSGISAGGVLL